MQHALFALPSLTEVDLRGPLADGCALQESAVALATKLQTVHISVSPTNGSLARALRLAPALTKLGLYPIDDEVPPFEINPLGPSSGACRARSLSCICTGWQWNGP